MTALRRLWQHLSVLGLVILLCVPVCAVVVAVCQLPIKTIIIIIIIYYVYSLLKTTGYVCVMYLQAAMPYTDYDDFNESLYDDYWLVTSTTPAAETSSAVVVLTTVVKATAMLAVVLATLLGNTLVIVGVWRSDKLRSSVANAFIVSLAGADLMVALLVMPFSALQVPSNHVSCHVSSFELYCQPSLLPEACGFRRPVPLRYI